MASKEFEARQAKLKARNAATREEMKQRQAKRKSDMAKLGLYKLVKEHKYVDVGAGVPVDQNIVDELVEEKRCHLHIVPITQLHTGAKTHIRVLTPVGVDFEEVSENLPQIHQYQGDQTNGT